MPPVGRLLPVDGTPRWFVLDPPTGLPIRPLWFPHGMVAGQQANQFRGHNINLLRDGFVTHGGQLVLVFEPVRNQFRDPATMKFIVHILSGRD